MKHSIDDDIEYTRRRMCSVIGPERERLSKALTKLLQIKSISDERRRVNEALDASEGKDK